MRKKINSLSCNFLIFDKTETDSTLYNIFNFSNEFAVQSQPHYFMHTNMLLNLIRKRYCPSIVALD